MPCTTLSLERKTVSCSLYNALNPTTHWAHATVGKMMPTLWCLVSGPHVDQHFNQIYNLWSKQKSRQKWSGVCQCQQSHLPADGLQQVKKKRWCCWTTCLLHDALPRKYFLVLTLPTITWCSSCQTKQTLGGWGWGGGVVQILHKTLTVTLL